MEEQIIKAQILFKDVVIDEGLQFDNECGAQIFETGLFYYVPNMPMMHREIWTEEHLIIFYFSNDTQAEYCQRNNRRGKVVFQPIQHVDEIPIIYEMMATCWLGTPAGTVPEHLLAKYFIIEAQHFKRILNLLVFS